MRLLPRLSAISPRLPERERPDGQPPEDFVHGNVRAQAALASGPLSTSHTLRARASGVKGFCR